MVRSGFIRVLKLSAILIVAERALLEFSLVDFESRVADYGEDITLDGTVLKIPPCERLLAVSTSFGGDGDVPVLP